MSELFDPTQKLSAAELAGLLNISLPSVQTLTEEGCFTVEQDGGYLLAESVRSYIEFIESERLTMF